MSRNYALFLDDIRQSCERIARYTEGMTKEIFLANEMAYDATVRHLMILGEAVKQIPPEVRANYPSVDWKPIGRFRDLAVHHYFGLDEKIVWDIVDLEILPLLTALNTDGSEQNSPMLEDK